MSRTIYKGRPNESVLVIDRPDGKPSNVAIASNGAIIKREDGQPANCDMAILDWIRWGVTNSTRTFEQICSGPPK